MYNFSGSTLASRRRQQWASYTCGRKCAACSSASCAPVVRTWRVRKLPATALTKLLSTHVNSTRPPGSGVKSLASSNRTLSTGTYVFSTVRCECISRDEAQVSPPAIRGCSLTANSPCPRPFRIRWSRAGRGSRRAPKQTRIRISNSIPRCEQVVIMSFGPNIDAASSNASCWSCLSV